jgi:HK97 gp10 family phage protein
MGIDVDLTGLGDLLDEVDLMVAKPTKAVGEILNRAGQPILRDLQTTTAFEDKSGKLRGSFKISKLRDTRAGKKLVWVGDVDREALHGWLLEYGTSKMPARPFLEPAVVRNEDEVFDIMTEGLREVLR